MQETFVVEYNTPDDPQADYAAQVIMALEGLTFVKSASLATVQEQP